LTFAWRQQTLETYERNEEASRSEGYIDLDSCGGVLVLRFQRTTVDTTNRSEINVHANENPHGRGSAI
jgi:hypothetical protein